MTDSLDERVVRRAASIRWRQFGSDGILLDPGSGEYLQVNDIGLAVWALLEQPGSVNDLVERVAADYDVAPETAAADIREFVAALLARRFVELDPS